VITVAEQGTMRVKSDLADLLEAGVIMGSLPRASALPCAISRARCPAPARG
jgi:hypothetical protein